MCFTDKPVANMDCPRTVRLTEGDDFFCLCKDISTSKVTARATWLQDDQLVKHSRPFHEEELYLKNVTARDAMVYICRVHTNTVVDELTLEVFVHPGRLNRVLLAPFHSK
jgi:hypothetical protein